MLLETQVRSPTGIVFFFFAPVRWAKGFAMLRRKPAAAVFVTAAVFLFIGGSVLQQEKSIVLTKAEKQLIEVIRSLDYGEVRVMIKDNKPIRVEEIRRSIQLPNEK